MAGFSSDKPVEEEKLQTEEVDPAKTTEKEEEMRAEEADLVRNVEEEQVRTEEDDSVKTTEEEENVRTEKDDAVKNVEEQRVRTEEAAPAKTTEEEAEDVRTDKDDSVKKVEEERVRTEEAAPAKTTDEEEDAPREEAIESLLDSSVPNSSALNLDEESEERNENPQEDSTMIPTSDQHSRNHKRRRAPQNSPTSDENIVDRVIQRPNKNPRVNQIPQNNLNQPFGVLRPHPVWSISAHGFGPRPNTAAWSAQIIGPNQTTSPDQQHPMANQLANIAGLQDQMFVPKPLFVAAQFLFQPHLNETASPTCYYNPLMSPEANNPNLMMPRFRDDQILTLTSPSGQTRRFFVLAYHLLDPQRKCVFALDDALVYAPLLAETPDQFYHGLHLFSPMDMLHFHAFLNHQQRQQRQSWRFNAGGSSRQGQDQQQP